ncbi:ubiquitin carboxyl-terminal hydrolase 2-like [Antedon mediterranea]|uniref:ubiquitin carboxyl-terminal hydrolase 2-like n=1 Tax=Antedon mediterranea TaxID=105859 RepID=UPI003AF580AC
MSRHQPTSMLPRRKDQGQRTLPAGPGPLNSDGTKLHCYKYKRPKVNKSGPVKAIHTGFENNNYTSHVGSLSNIKLSSKSSSTENLCKKFSSTTISSLKSNTTYRKSLSPPSYADRKLSPSPPTLSNYKTRTYSPVSKDSNFRNTLSPPKSTLSRDYDYNSAADYQSQRRRTQSFNSAYNPLNVPRPESRTRRLSQSENLYSYGANLPTDAYGHRQVKKDLRGRIGLTNIGNTCFMNSVLQCLGNCDLLQEYIVKDNYMFDINATNSRTQGKLIKAFANVMKNLWVPAETSTRTAFSPKNFKDCLDCYFEQFRGARQHDSQEFLRYLLEALHEDTNSVKKPPKYIENKTEDMLSEEDKASKAWKIYLARESSFFSNLFVGQLKSVLECSECNNRSVTFDPFWDLSLPIPRNISSVTLIDCLKEFTKQEVLDGDERPVCSKCKAKRRCLKSFSIQRIPHILVIHLKRFSGRSKLSNFVDFPVSNLSLAPFCCSDTYKEDSYHLIATSNHSGFTYGGHYIAHAKHAIHNKWFCYDDTRVDEVSDTTIKSSQAYVLFYQKSTNSARL